MLEVKRIKFNEGFVYDEELFVEAGEYDFVENGNCGFPMILVNDEWLDLCDLEVLNYVVLGKKLTKEEMRTVNYWTHCLKEVAKSHNIDLKYFIDALNETNV